MRLNKLIQKTNKRPLKQLKNTFILTPNKKRRYTSIALSLVFIIIIALSTLLTSLVLAQEAEYPVPLLPKADETGIDISSIFFSWEPFIATEKYEFALSKDTGMSDPIFTTFTIDTTYTYTGTLEYGTTYWWSVRASEPLGEYWSPASSFTTVTAPAATDDTTGAEPPSDSFLSSIIGYLEDMGWPMVGLIGGAIVIVIIAIIVLLKPKAKPPPQMQWQENQPPGTPQSLICPTCGFPNSPERKFCNNCGSNLIGRGSQQSWGGQQSINCPTCGLPNTRGTKFCSNCGTGLVYGEPQQTWGPQPANACPTCGSPIQSGQRFCSKCGASSVGTGQKQSWQVYQTFTCPICSATINKGINPCPSCGTWLDWGA